MRMHKRILITKHRIVIGFKTERNQQKQQHCRNTFNIHFSSRTSVIFIFFRFVENTKMTLRKPRNVIKFID